MYYRGIVHVSLCYKPLAIQPLNKTWPLFEPGLYTDIYNMYMCTTGMIFSLNKSIHIYIRTFNFTKIEEEHHSDVFTCSSIEPWRLNCRTNKSYRK